MDVVSGGKSEKTFDTESDRSMTIPWLSLLKKASTSASVTPNVAIVTELLSKVLPAD